MSNPQSSHDEIRQIFKKHVPEVSASIVELVSIAREPEKLLMVAVRSHDNPVDAVSACIGTRGIHIKTIVRELGEKVTVIRWSESPETLIRNSLTGNISVAPQNPTMILNASRHRAVVKVDQKTIEKLTAEDNLNLRLISQLVGWEIELMSWE